MASQYSILRQYAPYVSPYNIDLVKDVMMYKQQKVDAAREKIYTQVDYLMGQEIDKPEARAYMEDKMSGVIANINQKFKGVDLSSDGVTRAIQGEISSVLDDTVINAIAGTKEGKRVMKEIESIKQNHPELYSPINGFTIVVSDVLWTTLREMQGVHCVVEVLSDGLEVGAAFGVHFLVRLKPARAQYP